MSKFDTCLVSLDLRDAVPVDALRTTAADYQEQGMAPGAAMLRAVEDQLQLAEMEESTIIKTVRAQYEAQGGKPRPAAQTEPQNIPENIPAPAEPEAQAQAAPAAEPQPAPAEKAPAPIQAAKEPTPAPAPKPASEPLPKPWELTQDEFVKRAEYLKDGNSANPWSANWDGAKLDAEHEEFDHPDLGKMKVSGGRFFKTKKLAEITARGAHKRAIRRALMNGQAVESRVLDAYPELKAQAEKDAVAAAKPKAPALQARDKKKAEKEAPPAAPIDDFGDKLEGARKDRWAGFKKGMSEELPEDAKDITLAKHFPEPNYEAMLDDGADMKTLALLKAVRDEIPAKPRVPYKLRGWVDKVRAMREMTNRVLDGQMTADQMLAEMRKFGRNLANFADRIELYAELGYPLFTSAAGAKIEENHYSMFEGKSPPGGITKFVLEQQGNRDAYFDTRQQAFDELRQRLEAESASDKPAAGKTVKLDLYRVTGSRDITIGKKVAAGKYIDLKTGLKTVTEARAYLAEHEAELIALLEKKKDVRPERRGINEPRVGVDRRRGEDVSPEKFSETFGFRGVQFGNYVEQKRRNQDLNNAYDALLDMADLIGVPPRALSLNGTLGLAFGARGSGGKNPAAAHFEPDTIVINLTKVNGAGSLAHEWFHAFDNYFERMRGATGAGHVTDRPTVKKVPGPDRKLVDDDRVRPEVLAAVKGVMDAIRASGMVKRSAELDGRRTKDYWSTAHELAARAFESYIIDKAAAQEQSNDYLANIVSEEAHNITNEALGMSEPFPYPTRAEAPAINAAFDNLFGTVKTRREGDRDIFYSMTDLRTIEVDGQRRPIRNSAGELVAPDFAGQVAFWQSFSGEVDEQGRPLVEDGNRSAGDSIASDIDGQVAQAVRDGITVDQLLTLIESQGNADQRELATALRRQNLKTQIQFGLPGGNYLSGNAEQANGAYRQSDDTAFIGREAGAVQTALHELVHAATLRALSRGGLAAQQIRALHKHIASRPEFAGYYGITDPEEFIAEALTSPAFRQQLADTPAPGAAKRSLWDKFVGIVRMALGLPAARENVLARVMELAPDLMAENQARGEIPAEGMRASAQWASEAFRKWFGKSVVTNPDGTPMVVYHGTDAEFSEFEPGDGALGKGMYFSSDKDDTPTYGGTTHAVYLQLENPYYWTKEDWKKPAAEVNRRARKAGHDGIIRTWDASPGRHFVVFSPEQIKSATGNSGAFDGSNPDIRASMASAIGNGIQAATLQELPGKIANRLADFRNVGLQFLGRRQLVDLYADQFQAGSRESILKRYSDLMQQMDADKNESGAEADDIADRWGKVADGDKLAELMHDSTLAQIDPSKEHVAGDDKAAHAALARRLKALSPESQKLYAEARDAYHKHWMKVRAEIRSRIERSMPESPRRAALLEKMDATFYEKVKGVYFPLARFGDYVVTVTNAAGERQSVNFAETMNEAEALRRALVKQFPATAGNTVSKITKKKEFNAGRDSVSRGFMSELFGVLDQYEGSAELQDDINQLYLASMPDLSWTKHGIHRKGTPGFSQDARRAFAQNMFHGARYLAKLRYGDRLADYLDEMQDHVDGKASDAAYDSVRAQQVVDEMNKRHEAYMNPKGSQLSNTLTSVGFLFYLGLSPASAAVNLSQTPLVTLPMLAAKYGFGKASAALLAAAKQAASNGNDISKALRGDELAAYQAAVDAGVIDVSMAHDLAGIAAGDDTKSNGKLRPVMKWASWMFHHGEKFNRQASLLAAYRLARGAGQDHDAAYKSAVDEVYASHFDYSSGNRARVMQGPVARVVLLFKQYAQNMIYTLTRNAVKAAKGDKVALKTLSGLLVSHALAAGVLGLPIVGTLLSAASLIGGDDDEPWDAKVALRNYIADLIGQKPAEVMMHGFSRLTPFDISGRVGLDKLLLPDVQEGLEGARAAESWMTAALGPVAGIGVSTTKGVGKMLEGDYLRGLEDMLPVALRNPVKALRFHLDGVQDKTGIPIVDDTSAIEELGQMIGFSPSRSREAMEGKGAVYRADRRLSDRRSALVEQWANARMAGDSEGAEEIRDEIARFNAKNPTRRITMPNLISSLRARNKRIREAEDGIYLPKKHRDVRDLGRFAEQDE